MAGFFVDVQLEVLIIYQETSSLFKNGEMSVVALCEQVHVVPMCQLCTHFDRLTIKPWPPNRVNVCPMSLLATFSQARLQLGTDRLQIVVDHFKIGEFRKLGVCGYAFNCRNEKTSFNKNCYLSAFYISNTIPRYLSLREVCSKRSPVSMPNFWHTHSIMRFIFVSKSVELSMTSK